MSKTLMASAVCLALGFSGYAMANPCGDSEWSCNQSAKHGSNSLSATAVSTQTGNSGNVANEVSSGSNVYQNAFNTSKAIAKTDLDGYVSHLSVHNIGNYAGNWGDASGGDGGRGGKGIGGDGGDAHAKGGKGGKGVGEGGDALAASVAVGGYAEGEGGDAHAHNNNKAHSGDTEGGDGLALAGGAKSGNAKAKGGNGKGIGGDGGAAVSIAGNGAAGNGGDGGDGGHGGSNKVSAGTFDMSAHMASVGNAAAGIMVVNQNSGIASLAQQGVTVQANLAVGR